jgi:hypothetical protein
LSDATPAERATAASVATQSIDKKTKGSEPGGGDDNVHGPVEEAACEGKEPNQAEEDRQPSDSFGVDEALFGPCVGVAVMVKIGADDACDNTRADEFGEAKYHRHKTRHDRHVDDSEVRDNGRGRDTTRKVEQL